jgi:hypothetical protein
MLNCPCNGSAPKQTESAVRRRIQRPIAKGFLYARNCIVWVTSAEV